MFNETATQATAIAYVQNFALMQRAKIAMRDANSSVVAKTEELENIFQELARYDITMRERQELEQRSVNVAIALQQDCEILEYQTAKMLQYSNEVAKIKNEIVVK